MNTKAWESLEALLRDAGITCVPLGNMVKEQLAEMKNCKFTSVQIYMIRSLLEYVVSTATGVSSPTITWGEKINMIAEKVKFNNGGGNPEIC